MYLHIFYPVSGEFFNGVAFEVALFAIVQEELEFRRLDQLGCQRKVSSFPIINFIC